MQPIRMRTAIEMRLFTSGKASSSSPVLVLKVPIVGEDGRPASGYKKDFLSCFGIDANTDGKVCGQCGKAVTDHRKSGQKFFYVSTINFRSYRT